MKRSLLVASTLIALISLPVHAAYKCQTEHGIVYQDKPCVVAGAKQTVIDVRTDQEKQAAAKPKDDFDEREKQLDIAVKMLNIGDDVNKLTKADPHWRARASYDNHIQTRSGTTDYYQFYNGVRIMVVNGKVQSIGY